MTRYAAPGTEGSLMSFATRYDHWIGGEHVAPAGGRYFENPSPAGTSPRATQQSADGGGRTRAGPVSWWVVVAVRSGRVTGRV
ncbi:aldehyde dehydrogenase [Streptomyces laurentii]|uniref:Aldehyde dehydrogenase n=1 Tax=Streptomyces laurentii TaxID=39478 RepID=A0A169PKF6_STRLU|nr:aldehyde dehydrogenase [Streptomyces laurentii]